MAATPGATPEPTGTEPEGIVLPPYPHDRLDALRTIAAAVPVGLIDVSVGTPVDPMPEIVVRALSEAAAGATGYPATIGRATYREAAAYWIERRFGAVVGPAQVCAVVGTKELVASLPRALSLRTPGRDTVLYPAAAYPTYAVGAFLAGLRAVPVPVDDRWHLDLSQVSADDASRALLLWCNDPSNPTGAVATPEELTAQVEWARARGIVVASDECYAEFTYDPHGNAAQPVTALNAGADGVLAVHSLSKRSNMAGLRAGFVAGDGDLVAYLGELRKHGGLMTPDPVQAAAAVALGDDEHVVEQQLRYARRRKVALPAFEARGLVHDGGDSAFYLWLRDRTTVAEGGRDSWAIAADLAATGLIVAPGDFYGAAGAAHVRVALTVTDADLDLVVSRLS
jgi:succinyldiaminopimelate transaminase